MDLREAQRHDRICTSSDAGSSGSRAGGTTGTAEGAADANSVEARLRGIEKLGVYFRALRVNARLWKARMLPRPP